MPLDIIRPIVQSDARLEVWYRTNVVLYARPGEGLKILANLKREHLANLDLPCHLEIVGLKRGHAILDSTKTLLPKSASG
jgi:hypothetical protein